MEQLPGMMIITGWEGQRKQRHREKDHNALYYSASFPPSSSRSLDNSGTQSIVIQQVGQVLSFLFLHFPSTDLLGGPADIDG